MPTLCFFIQYIVLPCLHFLPVCIPTLPESIILHLISMTLPLCTENAVVIAHSCSSINQANLEISLLFRLLAYAYYDLSGSGLAAL